MLRESEERFHAIFSQATAGIAQTDLDGRFPTSDVTRTLDVLWAVAGKAARTPPFGRVVEIPITDRR